MALILRRKLVAPPAKVVVDFKTATDRDAPVPIRFADRITATYNSHNVCRFGDLSEETLFIKPVIGSSMGMSAVNAIWTRTGALTSRIVVMNPRRPGPLIVGIQDSVVPVYIDEDVQTGAVHAVGYSFFGRADRRPAYEIRPFSEIQVGRRFWPANGRPVVDTELFRKIDSQYSRHMRDGHMWDTYFTDDAPCYDLSSLGHVTSISG